MYQGILFFLGTAVAVGDERCAHFVEGGEIFHVVPGEVRKVSLGADFLHGEAISEYHTVSEQFVEYGFVVLLPSLTEIIAMARLYLDEIVAREGKNSRGSRGRKPYHQITGEKVMNFCQIRDLREARHWSLGGLLAFLGCRARFVRFFSKLGDLRTHRGTHFFNAGVIGNRVPNEMGGVSGHAKQGRLDSPGQDDSIGHEFVANRLTDRFYQIEEFIFLAWIDVVSIPKGEGLHLLLRLLCDSGDARQQDRNRAQMQALLHSFTLSMKFCCLHRGVPQLRKHGRCEQALSVRAVGKRGRLGESLPWFYH